MHDPLAPHGGLTVGPRGRSRRTWWSFSWILLLCGVAAALAGCDLTASSPASDESGDSPPERISTGDAPASLPALDIEAGFRSANHLDRRVSLTGSRPTAAELRPTAGSHHRVFAWRYRLATGQDAEKVPVVLDYADDRRGSLARGWRLLLDLRPLEVDLELPLVRPRIEVLGEPTEDLDDGPLTIAWETHQWPARVGEFEGREALFADLSTLADPGGPTLVVEQVEAGGLKPRAILDASEVPWLRFETRATPRGTRIERLRSRDQSFELERDEMGTLTGLVASDAAGSADRWRFEYGAGPAGPTLEGLQVSGGGVGERRLRFEYEPEFTTRPGLRSGSAPLWEPRQGDPRFRNPDGLALSAAPGLRFVELDDEPPTDLVLADRRSPRAWLSTGEGWREISERYRPPFASVEGSRPLGAQLTNFAKHYDEPRLNTDTFPALVVSTYGPDPADPKHLAFRSEVCFPPVRNGELQPAADPEAWDCDCSKPLRLPVPLQFEGEPWPKHLPGIAAVERHQNQGARLVAFDLLLRRQPQLFYIGQRYRDARSGSVLLEGPGQSGFRDTGNCREREEVLFEQGGVSRRVLVDTCQAFWQVGRNFWDEELSDSPTCEAGEPSSFWRRLDLDAKGRPSGRFVLPWHDDPEYHAHYEHFDGVEFPALFPESDRHAAFAVVQGRAQVAAPGARPAARHVYGLLLGVWRWQLLEAGNEAIPPSEVFAEFEAQFLDLDGDGDDEAIDARGARRVTFRNDLEWGDGWVEDPELKIPRDCDLGGGRCQAVDLDGDGDLDLLLGNGRRVYLNRSRERGAPSRPRMVAATLPNRGFVPVEAHRW